MMSRATLGVDACQGYHISQDLGGGHVLPVPVFAVESKIIRWLSIWHLVQPEPFSRGCEEARHEAFYVVDIVHIVRHSISYVNDNQLPVRLAGIDQGQDAQYLDLLDLASIGDGLSNVARIDRVIVAFGLCVGVYVIWVFPCLKR